MRTDDRVAYAVLAPVLIAVALLVAAPIAGLAWRTFVWAAGL